jgi:hypothetical protein
MERNKEIGFYQSSVLQFMSFAFSADAMHRDQKSFHISK